MTARHARKEAPDDLESRLLELEVGPRTLAAFLGISERQLGNLVTAGVVPAPRARGKYNLAVSAKRYIEFKSGPADAPGNKKLAEQRARLTAAKADVAEMERRRILGKVVDVEETTAGWTAILKVIRSNFLALPNRAAPVLATMNDPRRIAAYLTERVHEVLESTSRTRFVGTRGSAGADDAGDHADLT
jgi:phage terminase Nu1 subunit (DNA packaging protein)